MSAFDRAKSRACATAIVRAALAVCFAALLGACSSSKQPAGPQVFAWLQPEPPPAPIASAGVDVDDNGLPAEARPQPVHDGWQPVTRAASQISVAEANDEGLPLPKSPEEAGIFAAGSTTPQRSYVPWATCTGWKCTR
jgi:hypothetical protein